MAAVTDEHGGLSGLVTLEDLTETILGTEILDESDRIADMRQAAIEARERRLERRVRYEMHRVQCAVPGVSVPDARQNPQMHSEK